MNAMWWIVPLVNRGERNVYVDGIAIFNVLAVSIIGRLRSSLSIFARRVVRPFVLYCFRRETWILTSHTHARSSSIMLIIFQSHNSIEKSYSLLCCCILNLEGRVFLFGEVCPLKINYGSREDYLVQFYVANYSLSR
jgi:hypothetical protein